MSVLEKLGLGLVTRVKLTADDVGVLQRNMRVLSGDPELYQQISLLTESLRQYAIEESVPITEVNRMLQILETLHEGYERMLNQVRCEVAQYDGSCKGCPMKKVKMCSGTTIFRRKRTGFVRIYSHRSELSRLIGKIRSTLVDSNSKENSTELYKILIEARALLYLIGDGINILTESEHKFRDVLNHIRRLTVTADVVYIRFKIKRPWSTKNGLYYDTTIDTRRRSRRCF